MRCFIVDGTKIYVTDDLRHSQWAITDTNWNTGLPDLANRLITAKTRCDWMEIHCHGDPGKLFLTPQVDRGRAALQLH